MDAKEYDVLFGRLAIHFKILAKEQIAEAMKYRQIAGLEDQPLGEYLASENYIDEATRQKLDKARIQYLEKRGLTAPGADPQPASAATAPQSPAPASDIAPEAAAASMAEAKTEAKTEAGEDAAGEPAADEAEPVAAAPEADEGSGLLRYDESSDLVDLLTQAMELQVSDLHLHCKAPIKLRRHGRLIDVSPVISPERSRELILPILEDWQQAELEEHQQLDFSYTVEGVGRFRANAYEQQDGLDAVFRAIPPEPPTLAELGIPEELSELVDFHQGIVLFTGPAGCGKSSTMAAMVKLINEERLDHIITVEDPIEYIHESKRCLVNQRQVGPHTESFARALRAALREDPDIIVIGELRDLETISLALTAAETGHLVLGTLHTSSAVRTVNRLLGVFPPDQQNQIRSMVSESLRAVISQRLVPREDGEGRVAALEVLINTRAISNMIRENKTFQIPSQMQTGSDLGMRILDASLADLLKQGVISKENALRNAEEPKRFQ